MCLVEVCQIDVLRRLVIDIRCSMVVLADRLLIVSVCSFIPLKGLSLLTTRIRAILTFLDPAESMSDSVGSAQVSIGSDRYLCRTYANLVFS